MHILFFIFIKQLYIYFLFYLFQYTTYIRKFKVQDEMKLLKIHCAGLIKHAFLTKCLKQDNSLSMRCSVQGYFRSNL